MSKELKPAQDIIAHALAIVIEGLVLKVAPGSESETTNAELQT